MSWWANRIEEVAQARANWERRTWLGRWWKGPEPSFTRADFALWGRLDLCPAGEAMLEYGLAVPRYINPMMPCTIEYVDATPHAVRVYVSEMINRGTELGLAMMKDDIAEARQIVLDIKALAQLAWAEKQLYTLTPADTLEKVEYSE